MNKNQIIHVGIGFRFQEPKPWLYIRFFHNEKSIQLYFEPRTKIDNRNLESLTMADLPQTSPHQIAKKIFHYSIKTCF